LTDDNNAIGTAWHDCRIVRAKPINRCEAARSQMAVDFARSQQRMTNEWSWERSS
jgi:hypothetical protein